MNKLNFPRPLGVDPPPVQWRPMTAEEGDALTYQEPVTVQESATGERYAGVVRGCKGDAVTVVLTTGAVMEFDLDDPDEWADVELGRLRRAPMAEDGHFVLVTSAPAEPLSDDESLMPVMAATGRLFKLEKAVERLNGVMMSDVPTVQQFNALAADFIRLNEEVKSLRSMLSLKAAS